MAIVELKITDGTTTVALSTTTTALYPAILSYTPGIPERDPRPLVGEADGGEQPAVYWRNITETARIAYGPTDMSTARTTITSLNRLFLQARTRQGGQGDQVYVQYRPDTGETLYRSEILTGHAYLDDTRLPWLTIEWTRRYYWEANSETQLSLYNDYVSATTSIGLQNSHAAGSPNRSNVARIASASVVGDLPTQPRVEIVNTDTADGVDYYLGHLLQNESVYVSAFNHILQSNAGTNYASSSTVTNAGASGGSYALLNNGTSGELKVWGVTIAANEQAHSAGQRFRILGFMMQAVSASASDIRMRAKISFNDGTTTHLLWEGAYVTPPSLNGIIDFGSIQLPPRLIAFTSPWPLILDLYMQHSGGATLPLDFIQLTPTTSYRFYKSNGFYLQQNMFLIDDPISNTVYSSASGSSVGNYTVVGKPITLYPNRINALYLLCTPTSMVRTASLRVFYRARRLTI